MRDRAGTRRTVPYAAWLAQPAYLVVEVALALTAGVGYSLRDDTISALGTSCDPGDGGCSSAPVLMNVAFVAFGALQALGALPLVRPRAPARPPGRHDATHVVGWLWLVAGLASVAVGLLPVDVHPTAHSLAALPVFLAQPLALALHAHLLADGRLRLVGLCLGGVAIAGVVAFALLLGADHWSGAAERAAIWPAKVWLPLVVLAGPGWRRARPGWRRAADEPRPGPRRDGTAPATPPTAPGR